MELRLLVKKGTYPPDALGNLSEWEDDPVLQYRFTEYGSDANGYAVAEFSEWQDVPTVIDSD